MWGGIRFFEGRIASVRELRDRAGIELDSPLDPQAWRVVRAPSPLDLCPLYVIREPRSVRPGTRPGGDPSSSGSCPGTGSAIRAARVEDRARWSGSSWVASCGSSSAIRPACSLFRARVCHSVELGRGSSSMVREPWSGDRGAGIEGHGPRAASRRSRGGGRGPKNAPVLQRPRLKLDFTHWMSSKTVLAGGRKTTPFD